MVNTFFTYASLEETAASLDFRRLGKQRVEAWQIWRVLTKAENVYPLPQGICDASWSDKRMWASSASSVWYKKTGKRLGWITHPAVVLWVGYRDGLARYYNAMLVGWEVRGGHNVSLRMIPGVDNAPLPPWTSMSIVHNAFRWQLLRKELWQPARRVREPSWYVLSHDFISASPVDDYIWEP